MTATNITELPDASADDVDDLDAIMERACALIAPTWPLDRFIAVNPFWEMVDQPLPAVSSASSCRAHGSARSGRPGAFVTLTSRTRSQKWAPRWASPTFMPS